MHFKTTELMVSITPPKARYKPLPDGGLPACKDATSWCYGNSQCAGGTHQCGAGTACVNATGGDPFGECKDGGSTWCTGDSSGCKNGTNCGGTSTKLGGGGLVADCKGPGSTWCEGNSGGCAGGTHCVGATNAHGVEGQFNLAYDPDEMKALRSQLALMLRVRNSRAFTQLSAMLENPDATLNIRISGAANIKPARKSATAGKRKAAKKRK
jgi:hypothetical protein